MSTPRRRLDERTETEVEVAENESYLVSDTKKMSQLSHPYIRASLKLPIACSKNGASGQLNVDSKTANLQCTDTDVNSP